MDNQQLENTARRKRTNRNILIIVGVILGLLLVCGIAGAIIGGSEEAAPAPAESTEPAGAQCYPASPITDPELAIFAEGLQLPPGVQVTTGRVSTDSAHPGQVGVALDLCVPGDSSADALRPIATDIAKALKATPLGDRTFVLYVADINTEFGTDAKLKDPAFQMHLWNGQPSMDAELARWEVVQG